MNREPISKKLRFEVFKRDSFTCQYCGRKAPEVILQCDHIKPVAAGGVTDILNLATACFDCNSGKGARQLSDQAALAKQLGQLEELQERREQIEMLLEWREGLSKLQDDVIDRLIDHWEKIIEDKFGVTPTGRDSLRRLVNRYGIDLVLRAMQQSAISYLARDDDHNFTHESAAKAFNSIGAVANVLRSSEDKPYLPRLYYARGILRNRLAYVAPNVISLMEDACVLGLHEEQIVSFAKDVRNWTEFKEGLQEFIDSKSGGAEE